MISDQAKSLIRKKIAELNERITNQTEIRESAVEKVNRETSKLKALKKELQALKGDLER